MNSIEVVTINPERHEVHVDGSCITHFDRFYEAYACKSQLNMLPEDVCKAIINKYKENVR